MKGIIVIFGLIVVGWFFWMSWHWLRNKSKEQGKNPFD